MGSPRPIGSPRRPAVWFTAVLVTLLVAACSGDGSGGSNDAGGERAITPSGGSAGGTGAGAAGPLGYTPGSGPEGNVDDAPSDSAKDDAYTYQDDVVFVGGGDSSIVSASSDGLTYRLDGDAEGVGDIQVGSVVYVTATVLGRAVAVGEQDGDTTVTLGPVGITEVFRDAEFSFDETFADDERSFQEYPGLPSDVEDLAPDVGLQSGTERPVPDGPTTGGPAEPGTLDPEATTEVGTGDDTAADDPTGDDSTVGKLHGRSRAGKVESSDDGPSVRGWDDDSAEAVVRLPALVLGRRAPDQNGGGGIVGPRVDDNRRLPPKLKARFSIERDGWEFEPSSGPDSLGVTVTRKVDDSLKVSIDVGIKTKNLRVVAKTAISDSVVTRNDVRIYGIDGLYLAAAAGTAVGGAANKKIKFEIPIAEEKGPVGTLPLFFLLKQTISVTTALSGVNSTLTAAGEWALTGPIGIVGKDFQVPTFSTVSSLLDSISGIVLAPSGLVVGLSFLFSLGVGLPIFMAGPQSKISFDVGFADGSALGAPLARCKSATVDVWIGAGAGVIMEGPLKDKLGEFLKLGTKLKFDVMSTKNFIHRAVVVPNVPLCAAAPE